MTNKVIDETTDYTLQTGSSMETTGHTCYQVVNRVYDVIEVETQLLPQAYEYLEQLQAALDAKRDIQKEVVEDSPVVQFPH